MKQLIDFGDCRHQDELHKDIRGIRKYSDLPSSFELVSIIDSRVIVSVQFTRILCSLIPFGGGGNILELKVEKQERIARNYRMTKEKCV